MSSGLLSEDHRKAITDHPIIVFDAQCVLCSANAQFVLKHDRRDHFRLASMQGDIGTALYRRFGIDPANPETLILVDGNDVRRDSDAVLAIYAGLGCARRRRGASPGRWPWRATAALRLIPAFLRDPVYRWVARNRYRLFGRRETCWVPTADQARRVL